MNQWLNLQVVGVLAAILALGGASLAQDAAQEVAQEAAQGTANAQDASAQVLVVNGGLATAPVKKIEGRSYVDIEALAQIANGSLSFESNRINLTIPPPDSTTAGSQPPEQLSKNFSSAALDEMARIREWKVAAETMIRFQLPVEGGWLQDYHDRAQDGLRLATVAASTDADQSAAQLLQNEFANLSQWAGNAVDQRQALNATRTMSPDVLQNDQVLQKISSCSQFLGSMLASGTFSDNYACH